MHVYILLINITGLAQRHVFTIIGMSCETRLVNFFNGTSNLYGSFNAEILFCLSFGDSIFCKNVLLTIFPYDFLYFHVLTPIQLGPQQVIPTWIRLDSGTKAIKSSIHAPQNLTMHFIFLPDVFYHQDYGPVKLGYKNSVTGIYSNIIYDNCITMKEHYR